MKIYLTRHGETEWNLVGRLQGHKDSDLTELGKRQALWLGDRLKNKRIDVIISSSSGRTLTTSNIIRGSRTIEIVPEDQLKEIYAAEWEGMYLEDIEGNYSQEYFNFWNKPEIFSPEEGESFSELVKRAGLILEEIISKYEDKEVLIVTHALFLKALYSYVKGLPLEEFWSGVFMKATCLSVIEVNNGDRNFVLEGDVSHYK